MPRSQFAVLFKGVKVLVKYNLVYTMFVLMTKICILSLTCILLLFLFTAIVLCTMQYGVSEAEMVIFDFSKVGNKGL